MQRMDVGRPRSGVDYPRTFREFRSWFPDDDACIDYLEGLRWPDGFVCPVCGGGEGWRVRQRRMWMCASCGRKTSVTAGTIFHRSHTPISTWFAAAWFVTSSKNGVSALSLQQQLGFGSYETAWAWLHKLRRAMVRPDRDLLAGVVELDETFIGGVSVGKPGASTDKVPVQIAVEVTETRRLGRVRFAIATRPGSRELIDFACQVIEPGSTIRTDGAPMLRQLADLGYAHEYVTGYNAADLDTVLPAAHLVASLLKRWLTGTLHYSVSDKHFAYYLDEYAFRFNRRRSIARGMLFYRLLQQAVATDPHPLAELTADF
jgi:transposase-like protein